VRESKRKKLAAKGWRIGTPKDFLGMSDEEEAYVNLRQFAYPAKRSNRPPNEHKRPPRRRCQCS
jgi:hypothetical protein